LVHLQTKKKKNNEDEQGSNIWMILKCSRYMNNGDRRLTIGSFAF